MTHQKALEIAHLIKQFGHCMTCEDDLDTRASLTRTFNTSFSSFLKNYPEDNITTLAAHITRAIDPPTHPEDPINTEVFARVLPDLLKVRSLETDQDLHSQLTPLSKVS